MAEAEWYGITRTRSQSSHLFTKAQFTSLALRARLARLRGKSYFLPKSYLLTKEMLEQTVYSKVL